MMKFSFIKNKWAVILILLMGNLVVWYYLSHFFNQYLEVAFLDVGQGDAILIRAPGGRTMLIDGGPGRQVLGRLADNLPLFDREIDLLLETHPDTDHVGGLPDVLNRYSVRGIIKPCINSDNSYDQALSLLAKERRVSEICAQSGMTIDLGSGAKMEIFYAGSGASKDTNTASIVSRLSYRDDSFLFTGDTTATIEKYLVYTLGFNLSSDVLKVSHHGSKLSNEEKFLQQVKPKISIISAGVKNSYGHPHQEVLSALGRLGSVILRTDVDGTIILVSDGNFLRQK